MSLNDLQARQSALDVTSSFIIEAGAGAGKTSLMVDRYLALLITVDSPEQVLFCTFTRAATQEMVNRVSGALQNAAVGARPAAAHAQQTYDLALAVLQRDKALNWGLLHNVARLNILTLDGLGAKIAKQMPILSGMGGDINVTDDAFPFYDRAAIAVLEAVEEDSAFSSDVELLMLHMDGNHQRAIDLLSQMLAKRDQWLRHIANADSVLDRTMTEGVLKGVVEAVTETAFEALHPHRDTINALLRFVAKNVDADNMLSRGVEKEGYLLRVAELFLTAKNDNRKSVTKAQGFPAGKDSAEMKALWKDVSEAFSCQDLSALAAVRKLPSVQYTDSQWDLLNSLFRVLLRAVAELYWVFSREGKVDFLEVSTRAIQSLLPDNEDRSVSQRLFSLFKHIIVDEVQDINRTQYRMLELLVGEWDASMDNTLCLVGDPKQSIYRFREADVGLFLQAQKFGIANVDLKPLILTSNFRSSPCIVDFNNKVYSAIFPNVIDIEMGSMTYVEATSERDNDPLSGVFTWSLPEASSELEARMVSDAIFESKAINPNATIAVLVRSRAHLKDVAKTLTEAGVEYQAVEIENISLKQAVQDALSLSRALLHPLDNIAWLSILRMPAMGLGLHDLTVLLESMGKDSVLDRLQDAERVSRLSEYGMQRIAKLVDTLMWWEENRDRFDMATVIKSVWFQLEIATSYAENDIEDVFKFFVLLEAAAGEGAIDIMDIERRLTRLYAQPNSSDKARQVQLMTLHKSKGLEFDVVIMPSLGSRGMSQDPSLFMWHEFTDADTGGAAMMIAPIKGQTDDPIYDFLMDIEKQKAELEIVRLLYVGTTRAKHRLYLMGAAKNGSPTASSLFSYLWPMVTATLPKHIEEKLLVGNVTTGEEGDEVEKDVLLETQLVRVVALVDEKRQAA